MNKLFIDFSFIPATAEDAQEHVGNLRDSLLIIDHEDYAGYYSQRQLLALYRALKAFDKGRAIYLLNLFNDWKNLSSTEIKQSNDPVNVNGVAQAQTSAAAYHHNSDHSALFATDLAADDTRTLTITDLSNSIVLGRYQALDFAPKTLYRWFVANRHPQRIFDPDYKKHSRFGEHAGKRGTVSAFKYNAEEAQQLLMHAIWSGRTAEKRLIIHHTAQKRIVVFFNQNMAGPYFHGYHFDDTSKAELARLDPKAVKKMRLLPFSDF